ncbi:AsnC family protein, partial [Actinosynnema sp. NPDC023658]|uniref:AsnC family protein n=1 Tax=Actinosynnema sp. NPDC023658 TaxID=3155465 RepID=UPI0033E0B794
MQAASQRDQLVLDGGGVFDDGHGWSSPRLVAGLAEDHVRCHCRRSDCRDRSPGRLPVQDPITPDETDLRLVHALQAAPRATWHEVGRTLGVDPVTAARRWQGLVEAGCARVTAYP